MSDKVSIIAYGNKYVDYKNFTVSRSVDNMCGQFSFDSAFDWFERRDPWDVISSDEIEIRLNDKRYMIGIIDAIEPSVSANDRSISIAGREITSPLFDCHVIPDEVNRSFSTIKGLVQALGIKNRFNIDVFIDFFEIPVEREVNASYGDTFFDILEKHCKKAGARINTSTDGILIITNNIEDQSVRRVIRHDDNVVSASVKYDTSNRFSRYHIFSNAESDFTDPSPSRSSSGSSIDTGVNAYRTYVEISKTPLSIEECVDIAKYERAIRSARSATLSLVLLGWEIHKGEGDFWEPGFVVSVNIPEISVRGQWVVISTQISYSDAGEITTLDLQKRGARSLDPRDQKEDQESISDWTDGSN